MSAAVNVGWAVRLADGKCWFDPARARPKCAADLSGDTASMGGQADALLAIERHSGVRPVELHNIRRQDPARADRDERGI
jgi:hypothetical protein